MQFISNCIFTWSSTFELENLIRVVCFNSSVWFIIVIWPSLFILLIVRHDSEFFKPKYWTSCTDVLRIYSLKYFTRQNQNNKLFKKPKKIIARHSIWMRWQGFDKYQSTTWLTTKTKRPVIFLLSLWRVASILPGG